MILYNKLVRDNIPDIIQKSGKTPAFHTLSVTSETAAENMFSNENN